MRIVSFQFRWLYILWVGLLFPLKSVGQDNIYLFQNLTVKDNLTSTNANFYIYRDHLGFVWISSTSGFNRYDGCEIIQYHPNTKDSFSLSDSHVNSEIFQDSNKNIWFSTPAGIQQYIYSTNRFELLNDINATNSPEIHNLLYLDTINDQLWYKEENNIIIKGIRDTATTIFQKLYDKVKINSTVGYDGLNDEYLLLLAFEKKGIGIQRFRDGREKGELEIYLNDLEVESIQYIDNENVWLGTDNGLYLLDIQNSSVRKINLSNTINNEEINDIETLDKCTLILGFQDRGLYTFDINEKRIIHQFQYWDEDGHSPFLYPIERIYIDNEKILWISSGGNGIFFTNLHRKGFRSSFQKKKGDSGQRSFIRAITEDSEGRVWCLTKEGVRVMNKNHTEELFINRFMGKNVPWIGNEVYNIYADEQDRIWVASHGGVYMLLDPTGQFKFIPIIKEDFNNYPSFLHFIEMSTGQFLISSISGVFEVESERNNFFLRRIEKTDAADIKTNWILECQSDSLIIMRTGRKNLRVYKQKEDSLKLIESISFKPFIKDKIYLDSLHVLKIATSSGFYSLNLNDKYYKIQEDSIPYNGPVNGLLYTNENNTLWFSSNSGIYKYNVPENTLYNYDIKDGLPSTEYDWWSSLKTKNEKLLFGGLNGLCMFDPGEIEPLPYHANPAITSIIINNNPDQTNLACDITGNTNVTTIRKLTLPSEENTIYIGFAALEYSDPTRNRFRYRLKNTESDWVNGGDENFVRYPNLPYGKYFFELQATNSDGIWSERTKQLQINILPPWYLTWWAKTIAFFLLLSMIYLIYRYRVSQIKKAEAFKRKEAEFKQKEAEFKQQVAETETAVLRLQMNPHFLFNGMNSISSYILKNDMDAANYYLLRFSKLMRKILELAANPFITIRQEVDLLKDYLGIEALRFENQFDYNIEIDQSLDIDEVILPTMILQPFVENSILHGVSHISKKGVITIKFTKQKDHFSCIIEDNGPGLSQTQSFRNKPKHESKALLITRKRLRLLENETGKACTLQITDIRQINSQRSGTRVEISLPIY